MTDNRYIVVHIVSIVVFFYLYWQVSFLYISNLRPIEVVFSGTNLEVQSGYAYIHLGISHH